MIRELYLDAWAWWHGVDVEFTDGVAVLRVYRGRFNQASSLGINRGTFAQFRRQLAFNLFHAERAIDRVRPKECVSCGKWHVPTPGMEMTSCCVLHPAGSCCHFSDTEVDAATGERVQHPLTYTMRADASTATATTTATSIIRIG